ncbi:MAG: UDP-glucuronic acid decarboxylase family protein [Candidatus Gottesmanbacteria bacterium]
MSNTKYLIVGGAGFIGSHLCDELLNRGDEVFCIDNFITGNKKNIEHLIKNSSFHLIEWDITKTLDKNLQSQISTVQFIYHLASPASPIQYQRFPIETLLANSLGTYNLLMLAKEINARFLYASSSEIYGDPLQHPQKEPYWGNVNPIGIRSCYDEGKRFGEAIIMAFIRKFDLDCRLARIFNTYGPRMEKEDGRVVSNFIVQALLGKPITVYGDGSQTRSFCFVSDMVAGLMKLMEEEKARGEVFNLGNPEEYTILEIARKIKDRTASVSEIKFNDLPEDDPVRRQPDITRAKQILGWQPIISIDQGLGQTIKYFESIL